jgi:hypothetical protein
MASITLTGEETNADYIYVKRNVHRDDEEDCFLFNASWAEDAIEFYLTDKDNFQIDALHKVSREMIKTILQQVELEDFCEPEEHIEIPILPLIGVTKNYRLEIWARPQGLLEEREVALGELTYGYLLVRMATYFRLVLIHDRQGCIRVDLFAQGEMKPYIKTRNYIEEYAKTGRLQTREVFSECPPVNLEPYFEVLRLVPARLLHSRCLMRINHRPVNGLDCLEVGALEDRGAELQLTVAQYYNQGLHHERTKTLSRASVAAFFEVPEARVTSLFLKHLLYMARLPLLVPDRLPSWHCLSRVRAGRVVSLTAVGDESRLLGFKVEVYAVEEGKRAFYLVGSQIQSPEFLPEVTKLALGLLLEQPDLLEAEGHLPLELVLSKQALARHRQV